MVERPAVNRNVAGSSPASGAIQNSEIAKENDGFAIPQGFPDTVSTQDAAEVAPEPMKYPVKLRPRKNAPVLAKIYAPQSHSHFRVCWYVGRERMQKAFKKFGAAKRFGDELVKELANGSQSTLLTPAQATDALAAMERMHRFFQSTGKKLSLLVSVSEYCDAAEKLGYKTLPEAIAGYLGSVVSVKRVLVTQAVEEFIAAAAPRTVAADGQRAQLSSKYAYNRGIMLRRFANSFTGYAVCDLTKLHLDSFISALSQSKSKSNSIAVKSPKSRNHHREAIRQLLAWCARKDYLAVNHRLTEADAMRPEHANSAEVAFYTPKELRTLLETAEGPMRAMIAIGGLAGLRTAEILRLDWADVWRVRGHIEISARNAKTRQRRLVEIVPALAAWLAPFRTLTKGQLYTRHSDELCEKASEPLHENTWQRHFNELCEKANVPRKANGLRHAFCTYHFAQHGNENQTAKQAGNTPQMVHQHYKGLATAADGKRWFAIKPAKTEGKVIPMPAAAGGAA